jgi:hypothetical protein
MMRARRTKADSTVSPTASESQLPRIQIVNREHPHFEEYGRFTGKVVTFPFGDREPMAEVTLENCRHGVDGCFVCRGDVRQARER